MILQASISRQKFERQIFLMPRHLSIMAGAPTKMGRINDLILDSMNAIYATNVKLDSTSDVTTAVVTYDLTCPGQGNSSGSVNLALPTSGQEINDAIKINLVAFALSAYSLTIPLDRAIVEGSITDPIPHSFANPSRSLNSAFQISTSRDSMVSYTVDIAATLSLTTGQTGTVTLKYADDSGMTTNVVTVQSSVNGNGGTLAIGLGLTQTASCSLTGIIPAGKYVKLVTANTTGTPTFTMRAAQEVLL